VRNRALHDGLQAFAEQAGEHLNAAVEAGAEIPFEVAENPGAHSVLYRYKPLSSQFVRQHFLELRGLARFESALNALVRVDGTSAYLRAMGADYTPALEHDRAQEVLKEFLVRLWDEASSFDVEPQRFAETYTSFESIVYEDTAVNTVLAPILGVRLASDRWDVGSGMALVRGDLIDAPAESVWGTGRDDGEPNALVVLTVESSPQEPPPLTAARLDFRRLLTALRLFKPGPANLGPSAWWRSDDAPWQQVPLGFAGRSRGGDYWLEPGEQNEFCELFELIRSRPTSAGPLSWALSRFELGLEQSVATDGLSDHLLALRALFDGGEPGPLAMAQRLAALCAERERRAELQQRIERAFTLERLLMSGDAGSDYLREAGANAPDRIANAVETCMRALLRDMVCGHVDADVRAVADRMLGLTPGDATERGEPNKAPSQPSRPRRFVRERITEPRAEPKTEPVLDGWDVDTAPITEPAEAPEPEFVARRTTTEDRRASREQATEETAAIGGVRELRGADDEIDDWGFDDPADYSAAV
jgi:hypothetical protein